jgi:hypothetical protein
MACYSEVRFSKAQAPEKVTQTIHTIMHEKFGDNYVLEEDDVIITVKFTSEWNAPHVEYFIKGKKNIKALQYSDNCFGQLDGGWFANWLSSNIEEQLDGIHYSESLDEKYKSNFHTKYPTMNIWLVKKHGDGFIKNIVLGSLFREYLRELKTTLPKSVYKVFSQVK